eukprot:scaffold16163_cov106-Isochrysis_galbana.AAC.6
MHYANGFRHMIASKPERRRRPSWFHAGSARTRLATASVRTKAPAVSPRCRPLEALEAVRVLLSKGRPGGLLRRQHPREERCQEGNQNVRDGSDASAATVSPPPVRGRAFVGLRAVLPSFACTLCSFWNRVGVPTRSHRGRLRNCERRRKEVGDEIEPARLCKEDDDGAHRQEEHTVWRAILREQVYKQGELHNELQCINGLLDLCELAIPRHGLFGLLRLSRGVGGVGGISAQHRGAFHRVRRESDGSGAAVRSVGEYAVAGREHRHRHDVRLPKPLERPELVLQPHGGRERGREQRRPSESGGHCRRVGDGGTTRCGCGHGRPCTTHTRYEWR